MVRSHATPFSRIPLSIEFRMSKILSQTGVSLADVYDVKGSIVGVEELDAEAVKTVHEMGATIFSERLSTRIVSIPSTAIAQTITFNVNFTATETSRVLGVQVVADDATRVARVQLSITSPPAADNAEVPIFYWSAADDVLRRQNILIAGVVGSFDVMVPATPINVPNLLVGFDSPRPASTLSMRGLSTTFGAGTVAIQALIHLAFPQTEGLSSHGLPLPGW